MTELGDLTAPIMSAATRLHGDRAGRQRGQERKQLAPAQLLAKDHRARAVGPMELKDVLGEIESNGANLAVPDGIRLVYLPSYSPELQPAEHLWPVLDEPLANRHFATLADLEH